MVFARRVTKRREQMDAKGLGSARRSEPGCSRSAAATRTPTTSTTASAFGPICASGPTGARSSSFRGEPRVGRTGWTSSRRADGCRPTVRCERPCERAARQLIRRKAPRNQRCIIYFVWGRGGIDLQTPVDIAFRHCGPSEEIRSEIAAQVQRLEKFSPRITSCRVVVTGPQTGHRRGGFEVELRIAMPKHNEVVVDKSHADAPERGHCQSNFYTACSRTRAGWNSAVFAHELPTRSAGFDAENRLYLFALTVPKSGRLPCRRSPPPSATRT